MEFRYRYETTRISYSAVVAVSCNTPREDNQLLCARSPGLLRVYGGAPVARAASKRGVWLGLLHKIARQSYSISLCTYGPLRGSAPSKTEGAYQVQCVGGTPGDGTAREVLGSGTAERRYRQGAWRSRCPKSLFCSVAPSRGVSRCLKPPGGPLARPFRCPKTLWRFRHPVVP